MKMTYKKEELSFYLSLSFSTSKMSLCIGAVVHLEGDVCSRRDAMQGGLVSKCDRA